jgi:hypothetical protein
MGTIALRQSTMVAGELTGPAKKKKPKATPKPAGAGQKPGRSGGKAVGAKSAAKSSRPRPAAVSRPLPPTGVQVRAAYCTVLRALDDATLIRTMQVCERTHQQMVGEDNRRALGVLFEATAAETTRRRAQRGPI